MSFNCLVASELSIITLKKPVLEESDQVDKDKKKQGKYFVLALFKNLKILITCLFHLKLPQPKLLDRMQFCL